jgi:hypothetical protein
LVFFRPGRVPTVAELLPRDDEIVDLAPAFAERRTEWQAARRSSAAQPSTLSKNPLNHGTKYHGASQ